RARRLLMSGKRQEALAALRDAPNASHEKVSGALRQFADEVTRLEEQDRGAAEQQREAERREQQASADAAAQKPVGGARKHFEHGQGDRAMPTLPASDLANPPTVAKYLDEIRHAPAPPAPPPATPWWRSPIGYGAGGLAAVALVGALLWSRQPAPV